MSNPETDFTEYDADSEDEEIDEELDAVIAAAAASLDRGEGIPWEVFRKRWEK